MDTMDVYTKFDTLVKEMEWGDVVSTIKDVLVEMRVEDPLHSLLDLPLPSSNSGSRPAILDSNGICVQKADILSDGHCNCEHGSTALQYLEENFAPEGYLGQGGPLDKGPLYSAIWSPDMYNQEVGCHPGQHDNLPVLGLPEYGQKLRPVGYLFFIEYFHAKYDNLPIVELPGHFQNLRSVGYLYGEVVYEIQPNLYGPPDFSPNMFLPSACSQQGDQQKENMPYVKKPLNAFMWKSLTSDQKTEYFVEADKERLLHALQHPGWSFKNNYGKKKGRSQKNKKATGILRL